MLALAQQPELHSLDSAVNATGPACACSRSRLAESDKASRAGGHGKANGSRPTRAPAAASSPSVDNSACTAVPAMSPSSTAGKRDHRRASSQMAAAASRPSANEAGFTASRWSRLGLVPGGRSSRTGTWASTTSSAVLFMIPASTGCGTMRARRAKPSQARVGNQLDDQAASVSAVAEAGPDAGMAVRLSTAWTRPPMPDVTNAANTATCGAAVPSGENASTPSVTSTGSTVSAPVHPANISRVQLGLVRPSSLKCITKRLVKVIQCR